MLHINEAKTYLEICEEDNIEFVGIELEEITFDQLCNISDNIESNESEIDESGIEVKNEVYKRNGFVLTHTADRKLSENLIEENNILTAKVKKMSTDRLIRIFRKYRSYETTDRQLLISVVCDIMSSEEYKVASAKVKTIIDIDTIVLPKLSWENVKEIRRLYNIKYTDVKGKVNSCYSFNELANLYNLSHIFVRNICLGKIYKSK